MICQLSASHFPLRVLLAMAKNGGAETMLSWKGEKALFLQKPANMRAGTWFSLRCFVAVVLLNLAVMMFPSAFTPK